MNILRGQYNQAIEDGDEDRATRLRLDIIDVERAVEKDKQALAYREAMEKQQKESAEQAETEAHLSEQSRKLHERLPWLSKPNGKEKFQSTVAKAMQKVGYTAKEIEGIKKPDHRDAMAYFYAGKYLESVEQRPQVAQALKGKAVSPSAKARNSNTGKNGQIATAFSQFNSNPNAQGALAGLFKAHGV